MPAHGSAGAPEDAGSLLSMVQHRTAHGSELLPLDAQDLTQVATVEIPRRVPAGVHGGWVPDQQARNKCSPPTPLRNQGHCDSVARPRWAGRPADSVPRG
ncbi:carotenoid oxygenase family protein [Streptomyces sp. NBC_01471]